MICPNCGSEYADESVFCKECGMPLHPQQRKGRLWPPVLILILMFVIGSAVYCLSPRNNASPTPWFSIADGVLYFDQDRYTGGPELEVPATVDAQTVTALADDCFRSCDQLTTVTLPDTLEVIGENCFSDCESLRGIKLPEGLRSIGSGAFFSCGALEAVYVPSTVDAIGPDAFYGCGRLRHLFFGGTTEKWAELYPEKINKICKIYPVDGNSSPENPPPQA